MSLTSLVTTCHALQSSFYMRWVSETTITLLPSLAPASSVSPQSVTVHSVLLLTQSIHLPMPLLLISTIPVIHRTEHHRSTFFEAGLRCTPAWHFVGCISQTSADGFLQGNEQVTWRSDYPFPRPCVWSEINRRSVLGLEIDTPLARFGAGRDGRSPGQAWARAFEPRMCFCISLCFSIGQSIVPSVQTIRIEWCCHPWL